MDTQPERPQRPDDPDPHGVPLRGPLGTHETSGIQVRLGSRDTYADAGAPGRPGPRQRGPGPQERPPREPYPPQLRQPRRPGWRSRGGIITVGVAAGAVAAVMIGAFVVLPKMSGENVALEPQTVDGANATAVMPPTGKPIDVATADGSRYRIAAVTGGLDARAARSQQSPPPPGTSLAYIDYVVTNPSGQRSLLDFPGDLFIRRDLVVQQARGRCVWQPGVPENLCTPPINSAIVKRLAGGDLEPGDGGDRYMPPGSSYLVRATAEVPVSDRTTRADLRLYIWKQLYIADQLAKEAAFPG